MKTYIITLDGENLCENTNKNGALEYANRLVQHEQGYKATVTEKFSETVIATFTR